MLILKVTTSISDEEPYRMFQQITTYLKKKTEFKIVKDFIFDVWEQENINMF